MPALGEYTNVYNTALVVLRRKGYQVWSEDGGNTYCAERDGWDFRADSPTGLLGLVAIFEYRAPAAYQEYWWRERVDGASYRDLPDAPKPYTPVWRRP